MKLVFPITVLFKKSKIEGKQDGMEGGPSGMAFDFWGKWKVVLKKRGSRV
ncbi:MAG: hypothetical protein V4615_12605 [Bacteroidota bacterium]